MTFVCPVTLGEALAQARGRVALAEARILLREASGATAAQLVAFPERPLPPEAARRYTEWLDRRWNGEPIAYILGHREFFSRSYQVTPATLIPRPETEHLVEIVLSAFANTTNPCFLDLGTGSGSVAITIALECAQSHVWAIDNSIAALEIARSNAQTHNATVHFHHGSWFTPIENMQFDCIVSNPPYIADADPHLQQGDLRFEPLTALTAGPEGMDDITHIILTAPRYLKPQGWLLLEHGYDQGDRVRNLFAQSGYHAIQSWRDLAGIERISGARFTHSA